MTSATDKGLTIAQWVWDRFFGAPPERLPVPEIRVPQPAADFYNPLHLKIGGWVKVGTKELRSNEFSLEQVSEFTRRIGKSVLKFTDYSLLDETAGEKGLYVTVRVMPHDGSYRCILFRPHDEMPYSKELEATLDGGVLVDNETGVTYEKDGDYEATIEETSRDGKKRLSVKYWDFVKKDGEKADAPELYLVEMDLSDKEGWIQTYYGSPLSTYDVKPGAGHVA